MTALVLALCSPVALAREPDHGALDRLLRSRVSSGRVDYPSLVSQASELDAYLSTLAKADLASLSTDSLKAFWINAYNAITLDLVVDNWPLASIRDLDGGRVWDTRSWTVAGRVVTLNEIEHRILRPMGDPRIHAAINCAARGCPPMAEKAYRSGTLDAQLQDAVADWAQSNGIVIQGNQVGLSPIFDWFGEDFTGAYGTRHFDIPGVEGEPEAGINFLVPHLDGATRTRLQAGGYETFWTTYDWAINRR